MKKRIRVLIVDDSLMFRTAIAKELEADPQIEVVGTAYNPHNARDKILELKPDVLTLDVEMPGMSGLEFLKILMPQRLMPVIVVSAVDGIVFEALRTGAVDFVAKPAAGEMPAFIQELSGKIKIAAVAKLMPGRSAPERERAAFVPPATHTLAGKLTGTHLVAIGASTGGTEAISQLLRGLPANFPGIAIVQHMPPVFTRMYAERLNRECSLTVTEARNGDIVKQGCAYVAPGDMQMKVVRQGGDYALSVGGTDKVSGHCPSVDVLFSSAARAAGNNAIGVLLTGMGADGARGLLEMRDAGAFTIGQDQQSCVVYGMPMEAMKMGAVTRQASLDMIPSVLVNQLKQG